MHLEKAQKLSAACEAVSGVLKRQPDDDRSSGSLAAAASSCDAVVCGWKRAISLCPAACVLLDTGSWMERRRAADDCHDEYIPKNDNGSAQLPEFAADDDDDDDAEAE